jgi:hypothetical protein
MTGIIIGTRSSAGMRLQRPPSASEPRRGFARAPSAPSISLTNQAMVIISTMLRNMLILSGSNTRLL